MKNKWMYILLYYIVYIDWHTNIFLAGQLIFLKDLYSCCTIWKISQIGFLMELNSSKIKLYKGHRNFIISNFNNFKKQTVNTSYIYI